MWSTDILSVAVDDVVDESDDNEDTEIDTENEEDEKDHKSQVTSSLPLIQESYVTSQNTSGKYSCST